MFQAAFPVGHLRRSNGSKHPTGRAYDTGSRPSGEFGAIVMAGLCDALAPTNTRRLELDPICVDQSTHDFLEAPPPD